MTDTQDTVNSCTDADHPMTLTRSQWATVLDRVASATYGEVLAELEDADMVDGDPRDLLDAALADDGPLVEDDDTVFGEIRLAGDADDESGAVEADSEGVNPGGGGDRSASECTPNAGETGGTLEYAEASGDVFYPGELKGRDWWVNWVLAVRYDEMDGEEPTADATPTKQPIAPYRTGSAKPAKWNFGLDDDEHPSTTFDTVKEWRGMRIGRDIHAPDRVQSRDVGVGIIIPSGQDGRTITLLDWDDVRDPETGAIHPACRRALEEIDGYAEISQSGEGIHQFVFGEIPGGFAKFIRHVDDTPFVGDDLPQVEMYSSGRLTALTGDHVEGTGTDVVDGQDLIDRLCWEYGQGTNNAPGEASDPFARDRDDASTDDGSSGGTPTHEAVGRSLRESVAYDGDDPAEWDLPEGESIEYHAVLRARERSAELSNTANWELIGYAAALGKRGGLEQADVVEDLKAHPTPQYGFDRSRAEKEVRGIYRKVEKGNYEAPSRRTLVARGILPETDSEDDYDRDPREFAVVLDHRDAWEAAKRATPADLDTPIAGAAVTADGDTWRADGRQVDVVRAVAIADHDHGPDATLDAAAYDRAYRVARERYGAPLPEYVTEADAADRYDAVLAAVHALDFSRLDKTAFSATITEADAASGPDVTYHIDPTPVDGWRDSASGRSVLVFDGRTVWDAKTETTIDALRLVALDAGLIDSPTADLEGELFERAYRVARDDYGAPLPRWALGTPADTTPVLPPADQLADGDTRDAGDALDGARDDVEACYRELITRNRDGDGVPHVLTALPALGKTTSAIKTAGDHPTTYLAPRKELQQDAVAKAEKYDVTYCILPVFGGGRRNEEAVREGVKAVREADQDLLRDVNALADQVDAELFEDNGDADDGDLDRHSCPTAEGEHGEKWALAVHVARALDYTPRDIHERADALFGRPLPCQPRDGASAGGVDLADCEYSAGWDDIADPENPADLLIGSYGHAHVESARTHYSPDGDGGTERRPRAVVFDEYPAGAFEDDYGGEFVDHARWLAGALREDVADRTDLFDVDLWGDDWVRSWLAGRAGEDGYTDDLALALRDAADALREDDPGDTVDVDALRDAIPDCLTGALRAFVEDAIDAYDRGRRDAAGVLDAAATAATGGRDGCRELAVHAADGYAHRDAHLFLRGVLTPTENAHADVLGTPGFAYGDRLGDGTRLKSVRVPRDDGVTDTVLADRNHNGATIRSPPARTAGGGDCPVVGLDATGRPELWRHVLGTDVATADIHDTPTERARFAKDVLGLQVIQVDREMRFYEGDPQGKDLDGDVAALEEIYENHAGVHGARDRNGDAATVSGPATITTKSVCGVLEADDRLDGIVPEWENYGNVTGDNSLGEHQLGAVLGCQHYGDYAVEKFAALAGEEVYRTGRGTELNYGSDAANAYLKHMTEDQTMQAILRFTRGDSGATVYARTAALRDDLPVVGEGHVVRSWSETAATVAKAWKQRVRRGERFTVADVADAVDVTRRQVRRVLDEFADAGYLTKHDTANGVANQFTAEDTPSAGQAALPQVDVDPDTSRKDVYYTGNVRVWDVADGPPSDFGATRSVVPSPDTVDVGAPPG